jgi:cytochrome c
MFWKHATAMFGFLLLLLATSAAQEDIGKGQSLVEENCAGCHSVGKEDVSPLPAAPAFRTLGQRYPLVNLEEALAEGIMTGYPEKPQFAFEPAEIGAIIAFMESLQRT